MLKSTPHDLQISLQTLFHHELIRRIRLFSCAFRNEFENGQIFFVKNKIKAVHKYLTGFFLFLTGDFLGSENSIIKNPIVGMMIGIIGTVLVQSSSTFTSIVISMVGGGSTTNLSLQVCCSISWWLFPQFLRPMRQFQSFSDPTLEPLWQTPSFRWQWLEIRVNLRGPSLLPLCMTCSTGAPSLLPWSLR